MKRVKVFLRRLLPVHDVGTVNVAPDDVLAAELADDVVTADESADDVVEAAESAGDVVEAAELADDVEADVIVGVRDNGADDSSAEEDHESLSSSTISAQDDASWQRVSWPSAYKPHSRTRVSSLGGLVGFQGVLGSQGVLAVGSGPFSRRPTPSRRQSVEADFLSDAETSRSRHRNIASRISSYCSHTVRASAAANSSLKVDSRTDDATDRSTTALDLRQWRSNTRLDTTKRDRSGPWPASQANGSQKYNQCSSSQTSSGTSKTKQPSDPRSSAHVSITPRKSKTTPREDLAILRFLRRGSAASHKRYPTLPLSGMCTHRVQTQTSDLRMPLMTEHVLTPRSPGTDMPSHDVHSDTRSFSQTSVLVPVRRKPSRSSASCQTGVECLPLRSILKTPGRGEDVLPHAMTSTISCQTTTSVKSLPILVRFPSKISRRIESEENSIASLRLSIEERRLSSSMPLLPSNDLNDIENSSEWVNPRNDFERLRRDGTLKGCDDADVPSTFSSCGREQDKDEDIAKHRVTDRDSITVQQLTVERAVSPVDFLNTAPDKKPPPRSAKEIQIHYNGCPKNCSASGASSRIRTYVQSSNQEGVVGLILTSEVLAEDEDHNFATVNVVSKGVKSVKLMPCVSWSHIPHQLCLTDDHGMLGPGARLEFIPYPCPCHPLEQTIRRKVSEKKVSFSTVEPLISENNSQADSWPLPVEAAVQVGRKMSIRTLAAAAAQGVFRSVKESRSCTASFAVLQDTALECRAPWAEYSYSILTDDCPCEAVRGCDGSHTSKISRTYSASEFTQQVCLTESRSVQVQATDLSRRYTPLEGLSSCIEISTSKTGSQCSIVSVGAHESDEKIVQTYKDALNEIVQPNALFNPMSTDSMESPIDVEGESSKNSPIESLKDENADVTASVDPRAMTRGRSVRMLAVTRTPSQESVLSLPAKSSSICRIEEQEPVDHVKRFSPQKRCRETDRNTLITRRAPVRKFRESRRGGVHRNRKNPDTREIPRRSVEQRVTKKHLGADLSYPTTGNQVQSLWISPWTKNSFPSSKSIIDVSGEGSSLMFPSNDTSPERRGDKEATENEQKKTAGKCQDPWSAGSSSESDTKIAPARPGSHPSHKNPLRKIVGRAKDAARIRAPFHFKNRSKQNGPPVDPTVAAFECAGCADYLSPPVRECLGGHRLCRRCLKTSENCLVCGKEVPVQPNKTLDPLIRAVLFPCKNNVAGCKESYWIEDRARHEAKCAHRPRPCPFSSRSQVMCPWSGVRAMIRTHMKRAHGHHGIVYSYDTFFPMEDFNILAWSSRTYHVEIVFVQHEIFELHKVFDRRNTCLWGLLRHILAKDPNAQFCYTIRFQPVNMRPSVCFRNDAVSGTEDLDLAFEQGKRFNLHLDCFTQTPLDIFTVQLKVQPREKNKWT